MLTRLTAVRPYEACIYFLILSRSECPALLAWLVLCGIDLCLRCQIVPNGSTLVLLHKGFLMPAPHFPQPFFRDVVQCSFNARSLCLMQQCSNAVIDGSDPFNYGAVPLPVPMPFFTASTNLELSEFFPARRCVTNPFIRSSCNVAPEVGMGKGSLTYLNEVISVPP